MKRFKGEIRMRQWAFWPCAALIVMRPEYYAPTYEYRIAFGWLCFYFSVGVVKCS
jgi:hypothetical protein